MDIYCHVLYVINSPFREDQDLQNFTCSFVRSHNSTYGGENKPVELQNPFFSGRCEEESWNLPMEVSFNLYD